MIANLLASISFEIHTIINNSSYKLLAKTTTLNRQRITRGDNDNDGDEKRKSDTDGISIDNDWYRVAANGNK